MDYLKHQPTTPEAQSMVRQSSPKPDPKPEPITKEALLLVEGKDPLRFFEILCKHLGLSQQLQIMNFGGVNQLRGLLVGLPGASGFADVKSIGIIRDAETNATGAFQSVTASLEHALEQRSWDGQPAVDILILPGQGRSGMLETLLCETFADAPENCCIDAFFRCVEQCPDSDVRNPDKARVRAFLATKPDPYPSVGVAAQEGYWNLDHEALEPARTFLQAVAAAVN